MEFKVIRPLKALSNAILVQFKVKVKVKVAFISIIINDKNKLDTVITKN